MAIEFKRLPRHWAYPLQRNRVKSLLARTDADFRAVQFLGTARKPSKTTSGLFTAGYLDAHLSDSAWCFRLRLYGLPEEVLPHASQDVGEAISRDIEEFISARLRDPRGGPGCDLERIFFFRQESGALVPSFKTKRVEGWGELVAQLDKWWLSALPPNKALQLTWHSAFQSVLVAFWH